MHIKVHIEVSERGYAYTGTPNGEQNIDLEIDDNRADSLDISDLLFSAVRLAVRDYKKALLAPQPAGEETEQ